MNISLSQLYIKAGVRFPFGHQMQRALTDSLTSGVASTANFEARFGQNFSLGIWLSARDETTVYEILGPTIYKKDRDVEYTLFLPFSTLRASSDSRRATAEMLIEGVCEVLRKVDLSPPSDEWQRAMVEKLATEPEMIEGVWNL